MSKNFDYQAVANTVAQNRSNQDLAQGVGQFINTALLTYQEHLRRQRLDEQANQTQAVADAPKATAVLDENSQPIYQNPDGSTASTPGPVPTRDQEEVHNVASRAYGYSNGFNFDPDETPNVPDQGGYTGLQMRMAFKKEQANRDLMKAHLLKAQADATPDPLDTKYRQAQIDETNARTNNLNARSGVDPSAPVSGPTGRHTVQTPLGYLTPEAAARYYGHSGRIPLNAAQAYTQRTSPGGSTADPDKQLDSWYRTHTGVPLHAWGNWTKGRFVNGKNEGDNHGDYFMADLPGSNGLRSARMPRATFEEGQRRYRDYNARQSGAPGPSASTPAASLPDLPANPAPTPPVGALFGNRPAAPTATDGTAPAAMSPAQLDQAVQWAMANRHDKRSDAILDYAGSLEH